ncbi:hypothetical protein STEG23_010444, partial [Scotinomys teguina]
MDVAAAALPAFVALWLLSPWPLLGSVQGQFSAGVCKGRKSFRFPEAGAIGGRKLPDADAVNRILCRR